MDTPTSRADLFVIAFVFGQRFNHRLTSIHYRRTEALTALPYFIQWFLLPTSCLILFSGSVALQVTIIYYAIKSIRIQNKKPSEMQDNETARTMIQHCKTLLNDFTMWEITVESFPQLTVQCGITMLSILRETPPSTLQQISIITSTISIFLTVVTWLPK